MKSNGLTVVGEDALKHRWREWCIVLVAGRCLIGRVTAQATPGASRRLSPVFDFNSGFAVDPRGLAEVHRCFPLLALDVEGIDLPDQGVVLIPFSDLCKSELEGMEECVQAGQSMLKELRAARSGIAIAPPGLDLSKVKG